VGKVILPDAASLQKLSAILELALRSSFEQEKLTALGRAQRWFDTHNLRWTDLLSAVGGSAAAPPPDYTMRGWRTVVGELQRQPTTRWEREFLSSILTWSGLTEKQENVLRRMCSKYGVRQWESDW
jgi:hypothetical protein